MEPELQQIMDRANDPQQYRKIPGLFRRWEIDQVIDSGFEYFVETHGADSDGIELFALYKRQPAPDEVPR